MREGRRQKGFTLVEVVVAMALSAILFTSVFAVVAPIYRIYARTREQSDAQLVAGTVLDSVRATCSNAAKLEASPDGASLTAGEHVFAAPEGYLTLDGERVFADGVYNGRTIGFFCDQTADDLVQVTVSVHGNDGVLCTVTSAIRSFRSFYGKPRSEG